MRRAAICQTPFWQDRGAAGEQSSKDGLESFWSRSCDDVGRPQSLEVGHSQQKGHGEYAFVGVMQQLP